MGSKQKLPWSSVLLPGGAIRRKGGVSNGVVDILPHVVAAVSIPFVQVEIPFRAGANTNAGG